LLSNIQLD